MNQLRHACTLALFAICLQPAACAKKKTEIWKPSPKTSEANQAPQASSPDRLPPGKLLEGELEAFGFVVPKGMRLVRNSPRNVRILGKVPFEDLVDYVRARVSAHHAELLNQELLFPKARILGGKPDGLYELRLHKGSYERVLSIRDITPLPATPGISAEQRWHRAGLKPGGGLLDPRNME